MSAWTPLHLNVPAVSLACAAGVLAITQGSPGWAAIFVWELARPPLWLLVVFSAAAFSADLLHRKVAPLLRASLSDSWPKSQMR